MNIQDFVKDLSDLSVEESAAEIRKRIAFLSECGDDAVDVVTSKIGEDKFAEIINEIVAVAATEVSIVTFSTSLALAFKDGSLTPFSHILATSLIGILMKEEII